LLKIKPEIDALIDDFYKNIVGPYWDAERRLVDEHYRTIPFPFEEIPSSEFVFSFQWTLEEFEGYLTTWSSVQKYINERGTSPVESLLKSVKPFWDSKRLAVSFPLFLRCGRVKKSI